jgi:isoquinoline 1-oxidoreductase beta subunit
LKNVMMVAAERAGWGSRPRPGRARGIAVHYTFGSYAAEVAEVSVDARNRLRVHRVVAAVDVGIAVNPLSVEAQTQGGIIDGLSAAMFGEITVDRGRVKQGTFDEYQLLRHRDAPQVEVHIVPSSEKPTGFGEIALPPLAPAVANAIFAATGRRIRRLPFVTAGFTF